MTKLSITRPDDWHIHLRDGGIMKSVVGMTAKQMGRAIIMPNLPVPITTRSMAAAYRAEILNQLPDKSKL